MSVFHQDTPEQLHSGGKREDTSRGPDDGSGSEGLAGVPLRSRVWSPASSASGRPAASAPMIPGSFTVLIVENSHAQSNFLFPPPDQHLSLPATAREFSSATVKPDRGFGKSAASTRSCWPASVHLK